MPTSRTPGLEQYVQSEAARGAECWVLELIGRLELEVGYISQETCAQARQLFERARDEATNAIAAAE